MRFINLIQKNGQWDLDPSDLHHLFVMRKNGRFEIPAVFQNVLFTVVLEGDGGLYRILEIRKIRELFSNGPAFLLPLIAQDRLEWMVEKLVELGVSSIEFYFSDHTTWNKKQIEKFNSRFERIHFLARSACQQSGNYLYPVLSRPRRLSEISFNDTSLISFTVHATVEIQPWEWRGGRFLIGPEGDFSQTELERLAKVSLLRKFTPKSILRSETAAIFAASFAVGMADSQIL